eukprot:s182_g57.t1
MQWAMPGPELHIASSGRRAPAPERDVAGSGCSGGRLHQNSISPPPDAVEGAWTRTLARTPDAELREPRVLRPGDHQRVCDGGAAASGCHRGFRTVELVWKASRELVAQYAGFWRVEGAQVRCRSWVEGDGQRPPF